MSKVTNKVKYCLTLLLLSISPSVFAQSIFDIAPFDQSRLYLNLLFGSVGNVLPAGGSALLKNGLLDFNSAVLVLGGIIIIYSLVVTTVNTSHDGEMLGKRWNSVWIPLRSAAGFALLIPMKTAGLGGYAFIQIFAMYVIVQGIGAADYIWDNSIKTLLTGGGQVQMTTSSGAYEAASSIFQNWVCAYEAAKLQTQTTGNTVNPTYQVINNQIMIGFEGAKPGICGSVNLYAPTQNSKLEPVEQQLNTATITLTQIMQTAGNDYVAEYPVEADAPNIIRLIQEGASGYAATAQALAQAAGAAAMQQYIDKKKASSPGGSWWQNFSGATTTDGKLIEFSQMTGWFYAGSLYLMMAHASDHTIDVSIKGPTVSPADVQGVQSLLSASDASTFTSVLSAAQTFSNPTNIDPNFHLNFPQGPSGIDEIFYYAFMPAWSEWTSYLQNMMQTIPAMFRGDFTANPILNLQSLGHGLMTNVEEYWIAYSAILFGISIAGSIMACANPFPYAVSAVLQYVMPFVAACTLLIFPAGALLAYYIPFVPAMIFTMAAIGWLILCIETMVAMPIVALGILHPEGQHEVFGKSEPGIYLLINVFLRPSMMILGFLAAYLLSYIAVGAFNIVYTLFLGQLDTSSISIIGTSMSLNIYALFMIGIVQRCFSLIHMIPDRVMRWIGHNDQQAGEISGAQDLQAVRSSVESGAGKVGQAAMDAPQAAAEEAGRGILSKGDASDKQSDAGERKGDLASGSDGGDTGDIIAD